MADEILKRDKNHRLVIGVITEDGEEIRNVRMNDETLGVLTHLVGTNATVSTPVTFEDTSFVVGDSPAILDINTSLGRNGTEFNVVNDGAGEFTVSISNDGISFGEEFTMKNDESYAIDTISIDSIRITHVADSAYRVVAI